MLAKVLVGRLKNILRSVILDSQNACLPVKQILDGVVVVNHFLSMAKRRKQSCMVLKLDFRRAYDSVFWGCLEYLLTKPCLNEKWRNWMKVFFSSNSVSVLVNGSPMDDFMAQRRLKQGDPLAPFLFLIVVVGLAGLV